MLALLSLGTLARDRHSVALVVQQPVAVDGPAVDAVLVQRDADFRRFAVLAVLAVVTVLAVVSVNTIVSVNTVLAVLAVPEGGGGTVGEGDGVLALALYNGDDGEFLVQRIHQVLETGNGFIVDLCYCILQGGDPLVQVVHLPLQDGEFGLHVAACRKQCDQHCKQYCPNGFSHS